jgi:hypothetical protein
VHNPGALPAAQYFNDSEDDEDAESTANLTIVFENTFTNWTIKGSELAEMTKAYDRSKLALLVHSAPGLTDINMGITLLQMLAVGCTIWLTESINYTNFDAQFPAFVNSLDALLSQPTTDIGDSNLLP